MEYFISSLPILLLFVLMLKLKLSGSSSAAITLAVTVSLALFIAPSLDIIHITGTQEKIFEIVGWSLVEGVLKAVFPILLIIVSAIFSYNILVESGQIEYIRKQFISLTDDRGIRVLIIVWGLGGLLEGMAGFGTAVAIPAAILIGLGCKPFFSAIVALLGNTVATGFAAVGVPIITLCNEAVQGGNATSEMVKEISGYTIMQLSPLFILIPFMILMLTERRRVKRNLLIAVWVGVVSFIVQWGCAVYLGAETPAIIGSLAAIGALLIAARCGTVKQPEKQSVNSVGRSLKAWSIYIIILVLILLTGSLFPGINSFLKSHLVSEIHLPVLNTVFRFGWLSNAVVIILAGSIAGGLIQGVGVRKLLKILCKTISSMKTTYITIISLISMASIMNYTGMINTMAHGIVAATGSFYPFFAPLIGAVGTFVTGSDTSSNILFAKLQVSVAHNLGFGGIDSGLSQSFSHQTNWLLAANSTGATGGKMLSPQSIAIATAACKMKDSDDKILRAVLPYALIYVFLCGLVVYFGQ